MASSNSSLNLSFSTRVLLLLLFIGCFRPSTSAALPTNTNDRWRDPCAGDSPIIDDAGDVIDAFAELSNRSTILRQIVNTLKNDYVNARFDDESQAEEERVNSGLNITGSPSWNVTSDNMTETLQLCYENLARLAVLTQLTREAEETAPGNRDFANRFQRIEDHSVSGLYIIMCRLYAVMSDLGIEAMSPETEAEVANITFDEVSSDAIRHVRDYIVLLALEDSAYKLSLSFDRLAGQLASQTTPSTTQ